MHLSKVTANFSRALFSKWLLPQSKNHEMKDFRHMMSYKGKQGVIFH